MYSMLDMQAPSDKDMKGLQKALLKLIDTSRVEKTKMDKLKELVKNMTLGKGFSIAGYYALKDMTRETLQKFKIGAAGAAIASTLVLTGCSTPNTNYNTSDGRTPAEGNIDENISILTVPKTNFAESIFERRTDEYGEYAVTRISYPSIDSVKNEGVSKAILTSALEFYTDFVSMEVLDSIAFDNYANYDKWAKEVAPKYVASDFFNEVVYGQKGTNFAGLIFNNYDLRSTPESAKHVIPLLMRDGGVRVFNKKMYLMSATPVNGGVIIQASGAATIITDDKKALEWDNIAMGPGGDVFPRFSDGKDETAQLRFSVGLTLIPDGSSWKIAGYSNSFAIDMSDFMIDTPENLIGWRNAIK